VLAIVSGLAKGENLEQLELKELPNMPFLYWLVRRAAQSVLGTAHGSPAEQ
jgi:hypothetical protein